MIALSKDTSEDFGFRHPRESGVQEYDAVPAALDARFRGHDD